MLCLFGFPLEHIQKLHTFEYWYVGEKFETPMVSRYKPFLEKMVANW